MITGKLVEHFTLQEMMCRDGSLVLTPEAVAHAKRINALREWYNKPMTVNSWYRSPSYNKAIGGAPKSKHMDCIATDIALPPEYAKFSKERKIEFWNNLRRKWYDLCEADGLGGGFGIYHSQKFMHFDSREGEPTLWEVK